MNYMKMLSHKNYNFGYDTFLKQLDSIKKSQIRITYMPKTKNSNDEELAEHMMYTHISIISAARLTYWYAKLIS